MDEELKRLDLAIAEARGRAMAAFDALVAPQGALRHAAGDYIESVACGWVDVSRRASVELMARLSDLEVAELRHWTDEQITLARSSVERDIEACDFWIHRTSGLSPRDVNTYGSALVPRPRDSKSGIPQALVLLFERHLQPLRRGLAAIGLMGATGGAAQRVEVSLVGAWRTYREAAVICLAEWADVDDRYRASAARFQEMRWEMAAQAEVMAGDVRARPEAAAAGTGVVMAAAAAASTAAGSSGDAPSGEAEPVDAFVRLETEMLIPIPWLPAS